MLTEEEYMDAQDEYGDDSFTAEIGAEAIREMLMGSTWRNCAMNCVGDCRGTTELKPRNWPSA